VKLFCLDLTATQIAAVSDLNINTVDKYLFGIRQRIAEHCEKESPFKGAVEVDESFFGSRRVKGKQGRGAYGKPSCLVSLNVMVQSILKLFLIAPGGRYNGLFVGMWH